MRIMVAGAIEDLERLHVGCADMAVEMLKRAGADAFRSLDPADLDGCDGLLIPGGIPDIHPSYCGEENTESRGIDEELDKVQYAIIQKAMDRRMPIMGICRGMQFVSMFFGAKTIQDIKNGVHRFDPEDLRHHEAWSVPGSFFEELYGPSMTVNSAHHQALRTVPEGLRVAQLWCEDPAQLPEKLKQAAEGTLRELDSSCIAEAVYHESYPFVATQWHPELNVVWDKSLFDETPIVRYFLDMVKKCKEEQRC